MELGTPRVASAIKTFVCLILLDAMWFKLSSRLHVYPQSALEELELHYGLIAWGAMALAISTLKTRSDALRFGAAVGCLSYAVFNSTELALRKDWRSSVAIYDLAWGTFACAIAAKVSVG